MAFWALWARCTRPCFCLYVPEEVVTAAGAVEVGLCAGAEWAPEDAERYVPRNTCPLIKGFMGFKLGRVCPYIESADLVVGENTCDGKKKAYEQFSKLKPMYIMDVPHVRNEDTKLQWRHQVHALAARIEEVTGQKVEAGEGVAPKGAKRILYTGTPMAVPNWKLFNIIEKAGGVVVGEECCTGSRYYKDLVPEDGATVDEMLDDIADRYLNIQCAIFTPNQGRRDDVIRMARELHADGIIDASLSFCTIYEMEAFDMEKAAQEAGIPYMHLSTDYFAEGDGQLTTRIQAFLEMI